MDAVEYTKTLRRLCKSQANCPECPLHENCKEDDYVYCKENASEYVEKSVHIVEEWAKDHPVKTRQSEFLKMFPHANINSFTDTFCVAYFDKTKTCRACAPTDEMCEKCRDAYWNEEVSE